MQNSYETFFVISLRQMQHRKTHLDDNGIQYNLTLRKLYKCGVAPRIENTVSIDGEDLNRVGKVKYLGSVINSGHTHPDVRARPCW